MFQNKSLHQRKTYLLFRLFSLFIKNNLFARVFKASDLNLEKQKRLLHKQFTSIIGYLYFHILEYLTRIDFFLTKSYHKLNFNTDRRIHAGDK